LLQPLPPLCRSRPRARRARPVHRPGERVGNRRQHRRAVVAGRHQPRRHRGRYYSIAKNITKKPEYGAYDVFEVLLPSLQTKPVSYAFDGSAANGLSAYRRR